MLMIPGAEWTPLRIKLDPLNNPKVLHATAIEGPDKDKTVPVIYRLDKEADTLTLCFDERNGKAVPKDFAARNEQRRPGKTGWQRWTGDRPSSGCVAEEGGR